MNLFVKLTLTALVVTGGVVLVAAAQTPPPVAVPAATAAAPAPPPVAAPAAPASTATPAVSPDRFEPTDKVRADFDVSFPIDI